jgi:hypothetical protein
LTALDLGGVARFSAVPFATGLDGFLPTPADRIGAVSIVAETGGDMSGFRGGSSEQQVSLSPCDNTLSSKPQQP